MSAMKWVESILLQLPLRVGLGGAFVFAAYNKIDNVQAFAFAIKGFKILDPAKHGDLIISAAYTMPWVEMIAGVLLILGWHTRAAAATIALMLIAFMVALIHVIYDPTIHADCSCFGDIKFFCKKPTVGWCQVIRDVIMLIPAIYLIWRGSGKLGLDTLCEPANGAHNASQSGKPETIAPPTVDESGIRA